MFNCIVVQMPTTFQFDSDLYNKIKYFIKQLLSNIRHLNLHVHLKIRRQKSSIFDIKLFPFVVDNIVDEIKITH